MEVLIWFMGVFKKYIDVLKEVMTPLGITWWQLKFGLYMVGIFISFFIVLTNTVRIESANRDRLSQRLISDLDRIRLKHESRRR